MIYIGIVWTEIGLNLMSPLTGTKLLSSSVRNDNLIMVVVDDLLDDSPLLVISATQIY